MANRRLSPDEEELHKVSVQVDGLLTKCLGWPWNKQVQRLYAGIVDEMLRQRQEFRKEVDASRRDHSKHGEACVDCVDLSRRTAADNERIASLLKALKLSKDLTIIVENEHTHWQVEHECCENGPCSIAKLIGKWRKSLAAIEKEACI